MQGLHGARGRALARWLHRTYRRESFRIAPIRRRQNVRRLVNEPEAENNCLYGKLADVKLDVETL